MITNRQYFSWSQFRLWNSSKAEYARMYGVFSEKVAYTSPAMERGRVMHENVDYDAILRSHYGDDFENSILKSVRKEHMFHERIGDGVVRGYIDCLYYFMDAKGTIGGIVEYKTCSTTNVPIETYKEQMLFYVGCVGDSAYKNFLVVDRFGKCDVISVTFTDSEIYKMRERIQNAIREIADYEPRIDQSINSELDIGEILEQYDKYSRLLSQAKASVMDDMIRDGVQKKDANNITITLCERRNYEHPISDNYLDGLIAKKKEIDNSIKEYAKENGILRITKFLKLKAK